MDDKEYEQQYAAGYNNGYLLSRFEPLMFKHLLNSTKGDDPYIEGIKDGGLKQESDLYLENVQKSRAISEQQKQRIM